MCVFNVEENIGPNANGDWKDLWTGLVNWTTGLTFLLGKAINIFDF